MKVDINLLPPEYRPKRWALPLTVGLAIVVLVVGYFGMDFYKRNASANTRLQSLQLQLISVNAEVDKALKDTTVKDYQAKIAAAQSQITTLTAMEKDYEAYYKDRIYWRDILQTVREVAPTDMIFNSFEQQDRTLTIEGELASGVTDAVIIIEYAGALDKRGVFSRVAFDISTEERAVEEEEDETEQIFVFSMLLEVKTAGG